VGVEWVNSRYNGLSRAMALHVAKSVSCSLRFCRNKFLGTQPAVGAPPNG